MQTKLFQVFSIRPGYLWQVWAASVWVLGVAAVSGQVLYDAAQGTLPASQGWTYGAFGSASQTFSNTTAYLDSTAAVQAGYSRLAPTSLNRTNGFTLLFTVQVPVESHSTTNRAGFSVIVLGNDKRGIELGFWTDRIFAQADSPLFVHGEDVAFNAMTDFVPYALTILPTSYVLRANNNPILSGPVRDYTAFTGFPDAYETPNFLFLGDDTSSATAVAGLRQVILVQPPTLQTVAANVISWTGASNLTYHVESTTNFVNWTSASDVTSATADYFYTNNLGRPAQFYRVLFP